MVASVKKFSTPEIFEDLHRRLVTAELQHGCKLKSDVLRAGYGCSANTIREVLLRLASVGLVSFEDQRGFRVTRCSPDQRHDITKFRILLEQEAASLSIENGGLEWEAQLAAAHHKLRHIESRMARAKPPFDDVPVWSEAEWAFHDTLISACGSPLMRQTYANVYDQFRQQIVKHDRNFEAGYFASIISEHQAILDAALARNVGKCKAAIYDHLKRNLI